MAENIQNMRPEALQKVLKENGYIASEEIACALSASIVCKIPLLVEGAPGVGKTFLAKALAKSLDRDLIRLQFYEGITEDRILYDINYQKQLLVLESVKEKIAEETKGYDTNKAIQYIGDNIDFYGPQFLIERPILKAITRKDGDRDVVLLLDEVEKAAEEVEYTLLEVLDEYSMSIPQYGTIRCAPGHEPIVILTSNRYRELSGALKRRCNYLYIQEKTKEELEQILLLKGGLSEDLASGIAQIMVQIRQINLKNQPSVSEAINWGKYLEVNDAEPSSKTGIESLGLMLKNHEDLSYVKNYMSSFYRG